MENLFDDPYREPKRRGSRYEVKHQGIGNLAIEGLENGMTLDEVAYDTGATKGSLLRVLANMKYECEELKREYNFRRGLLGPLFRATDAQVAEICDVTVPAIAYWRNQQGIPINRESERGE